MAGKNKFITFKEGALIRAALVQRQENLAVNLKDIMGKGNKYVLVMYKKEAETFTAAGVDEIKGFKFMDMTIFAKTDPREFLMIIKDIFPPGSSMIWQSGICQPKREDFEKHGLKEDGCIWEGVMKFPEGVDVNKITEGIMQADKKNIVATVEFNDIMTSDIQ